MVSDRMLERGDFILSTIPALADTETSPGDLLFPYVVTGGGASTEFILMMQDLRRPGL